MASSKKPRKKYTPKDFFLPPIEIDAFIFPVENLIKEAESGDVFYNNKNEPLISLKGQEVERLAKQGKEPITAENTLRCFSEIMFQTAIYGQSDEDLINKMIEIIIRYDRLFVQPLRLHSPIQKPGIEAAKSFCIATRQMLKKTKSQPFYRVQAEILATVQNGGKIVTNYQMRDWLIVELMRVDRKKLLYLVERVIESPAIP